MPQPGEKLLAVRQPVHAYPYMRFTGRIGPGYGEGTVTREDIGEVQVHKAEPARVNFTVAHRKQPENYSLVQVGKKNWLLVNTTPQKSDALENFEKLRYIKVDPSEAEQFLDWNYAASPKIDGAQVVAELFGDKMRVLSYRRQKETGRPIEHTQRLGLETTKVPSELAGTVLKGEAYLTRKGRAVEPQEVSGFLNASLARAIRQRAKLEPRLAVFDILKYQGKPVSPEYRKRLELMQRLVPTLANPRIHVVPTEVDPAKSRALLEQVRAGRHPLTREGLVFTPLSGGVPRKLKFHEEHDVYIRNIVPAITEGKARAGAIEYSLEPEGPIVGKVGGGWDMSTATDMLQNPDKYVGRVARVRAQQQYPGGALRAPTFLALHEDYPLVKESVEKTALEIDLKKGDTILTGRFRNVPVKVKSIGKDELGQPTINGRKMLNFRIQKLMPKQSEEMENVKIVVVDGTKVRNEFFTDFTQAGHGYVYSFIPKDEVWVEECLPAEDKQHALRHELRERKLMKDEGLKYDEAHERVTELEHDERGGEADDDHAYRKEASMQHPMENLAQFLRKEAQAAALPRLILSPYLIQQGAQGTFGGTAPWLGKLENVATAVGSGADLMDPSWIKQEIPAAAKWGQAAGQAFKSRFMPPAGATGNFGVASRFIPSAATMGRIGAFGKFMGTKVAPPAQIAAFGLNAAKQFFQDPTTGQWGTSNMGQNFRGNMEQAIGNVGTDQWSILRGAREGALNPMGSIAAVGTSVADTGKALWNAATSGWFGAKQPGSQ